MAVRSFSMRGSIPAGGDATAVFVKAIRTNTANLFIRLSCVDG